MLYFPMAPHLYTSFMKSFKNWFLATQDRIFLPYTHRGMVSKQTPRKHEPKILKTSSTPSSAIQELTK